MSLKGPNWKHGRLLGVVVRKRASKAGEGSDKVEFSKFNYYTIVFLQLTFS